MSSKLPPLNFAKEIKRLDKHDVKVHTEKKNVEFENCNHKQAKIVNNELRCPCGAVWTGPNLIRLFEYFQKQ